MDARRTVLPIRYGRILARDNLGDDAFGDLIRRPAILAVQVVPERDADRSLRFAVPGRASGMNARIVRMNHDSPSRTSRTIAP